MQLENGSINLFKCNKMKSIDKNINLIEVYEVLNKFIHTNSNPLTERLSIYRFLNKLSDTEEFELRVNREFSAYKLKNQKDKYLKLIEDRKEIQLPCEFTLVPYQLTNWRLYWKDDLFLDSFDESLAKRIAFDINVAYAVKCSRNRRK